MIQNHRPEVVLFAVTGALIVFQDVLHDLTLPGWASKALIGLAGVALGAVRLYQTPPDKPKPEA